MKLLIVKSVKRKTKTKNKNKASKKRKKRAATFLKKDIAAFCERDIIVFVMKNITTVTAEAGAANNAARTTFLQKKLKSRLTYTRTRLI